MQHLLIGEFQMKQDRVCHFISFLITAKNSRSPASYALSPTEWEPGIGTIGTNPQHVLDVGTGTGIWAKEFGKSIFIL